MYFKELDMPVCLADLNLGEIDTERLTELCSYGYSRTIGTFKVLDADGMRKIYLAART